MKELLKNKKSRFAVLLSLVLMAVLSMAAKADEEDDYEISSQSALPNQAAQTKTTTSTKVITLPDSDGDGLLDKDDPHPKVAEIYIVEDKDKNGIVDDFEK